MRHVGSGVWAAAAIASSASMLGNCASYSWCATTATRLLDRRETSSLRLHMPKGSKSGVQNVHGNGGNNKYTN